MPNQNCLAVYYFLPNSSNNEHKKFNYYFKKRYILSRPLENNINQLSKNNLTLSVSNLIYFIIYFYYLKPFSNKLINSDLGNDESI
jgi:hypothetical protein